MPLLLVSSWQRSKLGIQMQPHTYSLTLQTICDTLGVLACITDKLSFFVETQEWSLPDMPCLCHQHHACFFVPFCPLLQALLQGCCYMASVVEQDVHCRTEVY